MELRENAAGVAEYEWARKTKPRGLKCKGLFRTGKTWFVLMEESSTGKGRGYN